jgi:hypothetical protein
MYITVTISAGIAAVRLLNPRPGILFLGYAASAAVGYFGSTYLWNIYCIDSLYAKLCDALNSLHSASLMFDKSCQKAATAIKEYELISLGYRL